MKCPYCGVHYMDDERECPICGKRSPIFGQKKTAHRHKSLEDVPSTTCSHRDTRDRAGKSREIGRDLEQYPSKRRPAEKQKSKKQKTQTKSWTSAGQEQSEKKKSGSCLVRLILFFVIVTGVIPALFSSCGNLIDSLSSELNFGLSWDAIAMPEPEPVAPETDVGEEPLLSEDEIQAIEQQMAPMLEQYYVAQGGSDVEIAFSAEDYRYDLYWEDDSETGDLYWWYNDMTDLYPEEFPPDTYAGFVLSMERDAGSDEPQSEEQTSCYMEVYVPYDLLGQETAELVMYPAYENEKPVWMEDETMLVLRAD